MSKLVKTVIDIALAEVGYLEKKSNSNLHDKTANAGSNNYTKYGKEMHDIYPSVMDYPAYWCDAFVDWCFYKAYGVANAKGLIGGNFNDYTVASAQLYRNKKAYYKKNPQIGDQIFFNNGKRICHTGLVYKVDTSKVYTIEGNTSNASGVVANGGGVALKSYALSYVRIDGYGRPKYDAETTTPKPTVTTPSNYLYKGLDYSRVFDATFYANKYGDLKDNFGTDKTKLFNHFIKNGINEGRQAISTFDIKVYKANNSDLYKQYSDDMQSYIIHYLTYGYKEVRIKV